MNLLKVIVDDHGWKIATFCCLLVILFYSMNIQAEMQKFNETMCFNALINGSLQTYNYSYVNSNFTTYNSNNSICPVCDCGNRS